MKLDRKNVRTILLIIAFAVLLYTAAQNLASVYGAVRTVWRVFGVVITGLAMAFVLNVPLKLFENRVFYGMSEDRRPLVRKLRRPVSLVFALVVSLGLIGEVIGALLILIVSPLKALLFVVMVLAIQQVDGAFIYPRIVGKSVGLPGVAVFCAVIVGGNVAGVLGSLLGVPVCALLYALLREAVDARQNRRESSVV